MFGAARARADVVLEDEVFRVAVAPARHPIGKKSRLAAAGLTSDEQGAIMP